MTTLLTHRYLGWADRAASTHHLGELLRRLRHSFSVVAVHHEDQTLQEENKAVLSLR